MTFIAKDTANIIKSFSSDTSLRLVSKDWSDQYAEHKKMMESNDPQEAYNVARQIIGDARASLWIYKKFNVPKLIIEATNNVPDVNRSKFLLNIFATVAETKEYTRENYFYHKLYDIAFESPIKSCVYEYDFRVMDFIYGSLLPFTVIILSTVTFFIYISILSDKGRPDFMVGCLSIFIMAMLQIFFLTARLVYKIIRNVEKQAYEFESYPTPKLLKV